MAKWVASDGIVRYQFKQCERCELVETDIPGKPGYCGEDAQKHIEPVIIAPTWAIRYRIRQIVTNVR